MTNPIIMDPIEKLYRQKAKARNSRKIKNAKAPPAKKSRKVPVNTKTIPVPASTKRQQVIDCLSIPSGTTLPILMTTTGWQAHSVRGMLSTLRKNGFSIITERREDQETIYRINPICESSS